MYRNATVEFIKQGLTHSMVMQGVTAGNTANINTIEKLYKDELIFAEEYNVLKQFNKWLYSYNTRSESR